MSSFVRNMMKGGYKLETRLNYRGAPGHPSGIVAVKFTLLDQWLHALDAKTNRALFYAGRTALRAYKKLLGKKRPQQFTKTGRITKRWQQYQAGQRHPYPYKVTGVLREGTEFVVDKEVKGVICGPYLISGVQGATKPSKPVPQLLEEGGTSIIGVRMKRGRMRWVPVTYRSFAYKAEPGEKQFEAFQKVLGRPGWR